MLAFIQFIISIFLFYVMFCLAYSFGMKDAEGKPTIDPRLRWMALGEFLAIYFLLNIFNIIGFFSNFQ